MRIFSKVEPTMIQIIFFIMCAALDVQKKLEPEPQSIIFVTKKS